MKTYTLIKQTFYFTVLLAFGFTTSHAIMPPPLWPGSIRLSTGKVGKMDLTKAGISKADISKAVSQSSLDAKRLAESQVNKTYKFMSNLGNPTTLEVWNETGTTIGNAEKFVKELGTTEDFVAKQKAIIKAFADEGETDYAGHLFMEKIKNASEPATVKSALTDYFYLNTENPVDNFIINHPDRLSRVPGLEEERQALSLRSGNANEIIKNIKEITMKIETEQRLKTLQEIHSDLAAFIRERGYQPFQTRDPLERSIFMTTNFLFVHREVPAGVPVLIQEYNEIQRLWNSVTPNVMPWEQFQEAYTQQLANPGLRLISDKDLFYYQSHRNSEIRNWFYNTTSQFRR